MGNTTSENCYLQALNQSADPMQALIQCEQAGAHTHTHNYMIMNLDQDDCDNQGYLLSLYSKGDHEKLKACADKKASESPAKAKPAAEPIVAKKKPVATPTVAPTVAPVSPVAPAAPVTPVAPVAAPTNPVILGPGPIITGTVTPGQTIVTPNGTMVPVHPDRVNCDDLIQVMDLYNYYHKGVKKSLLDMKAHCNNHNANLQYVTITQAQEKDVCNDFGYLMSLYNEYDAGSKSMLEVQDICNENHTFKKDLIVPITGTYHGNTNFPGSIGPVITGSSAASSVAGFNGASSSASSASSSTSYIHGY